MHFLVCIQAKGGWALYPTTSFACLSPHIALPSLRGSAIGEQICKTVFLEFREGYLAEKQLGGLEHNSKVSGWNRVAMTLSRYPLSMLLNPLHYSSVHFNSFLLSLTTGVSNNSLCLLLALFQGSFSPLSFSLSLTFSLWQSFCHTVCSTASKMCCRNDQKYKMSSVCQRTVSCGVAP